LTRLRSRPELPSRLNRCLFKLITNNILCKEFGFLLYGLRLGLCLDRTFLICLRCRDEAWAMFWGSRLCCWTKLSRYWLFNRLGDINSFWSRLRVRPEILSRLIRLRTRSDLRSCEPLKRLISMAGLFFSLRNSSKLWSRYKLGNRLRTRCKLLSRSKLLNRLRSRPELLSRLTNMWKLSRLRCRTKLLSRFGTSSKLWCRLNKMSWLRSSP